MQEENVFHDFIMCLAKNVEEMREVFSKKNSVYNIFVWLPIEWQNDLYLASEVVEKDLMFDAVNPDFFKDDEFLECALIGLMKDNIYVKDFIVSSTNSQVLLFDKNVYNLLTSNDCFKKVIKTQASSVSELNNKIVINDLNKERMLQSFFTIHDEKQMREDLIKVSTVKAYIRKF